MKRLFVQNWVGMCLVRERVAGDWKGVCKMVKTGCNNI